VMIFPLNANGAWSKYASDAGEPRSLPMSRQSLAVKAIAAVIRHSALRYDLTVDHPICCGYTNRYHREADLSLLVSAR
jgi:hypothetical protein